jgi:hypothetical protein
MLIEGAIIGGIDGIMYGLGGPIIGLWWFTPPNE